ncbi:conserved hypothetical protein [Bradyrhizobium sp. ORS 375]|uniref:hypothetical protein n=1 Tax=Bradyrhizobium sp. (strain ORS 375) TaxID=566679 RepID=UPI00024079F6|nr:hypothetical protein [Bradyrhizobium sp. ORS 375]CCD91429.1 conserved hypothetical protein [Bradyrhizobium sp. ORS 375]
MSRQPTSAHVQPHSAATAEFPWLAGAMLAVEAGEVIRLRLEKFARGDQDSPYEAQLMVGEKIAAAFEAAASLCAGASVAAIVGRYREHVAANARRLST